MLLSGYARTKEDVETLRKNKRTTRLARNMKLLKINGVILTEPINPQVVQITTWINQTIGQQ